MPRPTPDLNPSRPLTVGSLGDAGLLASLSAAELADSCDLVEIRLDLMAAAGTPIEPSLWQHLKGLPLLFTARCSAEGGAGDLSAKTRVKLLLSAIEDASLIDVELSSLPDMQELVKELEFRKTPWIASHHNFSAVPELNEMRALHARAAAAGAATFKVAAELGRSPRALIPLAALFDSPSEIPVSAMGMGPLAPVSRLLLAQLGSVLNYGYLGSSPTAPGQWSARRLRQAIQSLTPLG